MRIKEMKPSKSKYDEAKKNVKILKESISFSQNKIMDLVDKLSIENQNLRDYQKLLDENQKVVTTYDLYEEVAYH